MVDFTPDGDHSESEPPVQFRRGCMHGGPMPRRNTGVQVEPDGKIVAMRQRRVGQIGIGVPEPQDVAVANGTVEIQVRVCSPPSRARRCAPPPLRGADGLDGLDGGSVHARPDWLSSITAMLAGARRQQVATSGCLRRPAVEPVSGSVWSAWSAATQPRAFDPLAIRRV